MIDAADRTVHSATGADLRTTPEADAVVWALGYLLRLKSEVEGGFAFCSRSVADMRGVQDVFAECELQTK